MTPTFKDLVDLIDALAWPTVVLILALGFRRQLRGFLATVIERATKVSGLGWTVEMAANQVESERLGEDSSAEDKAKALRELEVAKAAAKKFDYWMKRYSHPSDRSDRELLLDWLSADRGARYVSGDYGVFSALAEVAKKMGYDTLPPPSAGEFQIKLIEEEEREARRTTSR